MAYAETATRSGVKSHLLTDAAGALLVARPVANGAAAQTITMSASSQQSSVAPAGTYGARIATGAQPAWYLTGSNPTAVANTTNYLPPNWVEEISILAAERIAVLQAGTAGTINIRWLV